MTARAPVNDQGKDEARPPRLLGLAPLISRNTRLLILGSFPGAASLAQQQYYAHPQNHFWKILQAIWPSSPREITTLSYEKRSKWLLEKGVGVWDVYASCERAGSLDSAIRVPQVNDFAGLLLRCPQLRVIAHNGGESFRHANAVRSSLSQCESTQGAMTPSAIPCCKLPSTSAANASWSFERKLSAWREVVALAALI